VRQVDHHLFPPALPEGEVSRFPAAGFGAPAVGVVFAGGRADGGVPLGGLGAGYLTLKADGALGQTTIFNHFPEPRDLDASWLGLAVGEQVRVLSLRPPAGATGARQIRYWGHFPVADLEYELDLPVRVSLRAFAPFIPGDAAASNLPAAIFELRLTNLEATPQDVRLALSLPGPASPGLQMERAPLTGADGQGVVVSHLLFGRRGGYALAATGPIAGLAVGKALIEAADWAGLTGAVAPAAPNEPGTSLVADLTLAAGASAGLRFVLAWFYPDFMIVRPYRHRYSRRFAGVEEVARAALAGAPALLRRTLAWQEVVYTADALPLWLRDWLVNSLYSLAKNSWWTVADRPDDWWGADGLFTHSESFTGCPITETIVCRFHGHFPTLFLFPELERTTLNAFAHFQLKSGEIPFSFGQPASLYEPQYTTQHPLNSAQFIQLVYRYLQRTGDTESLRALYPAVEGALTFMRALDGDGDGLIDEHPHALPGERWPANQFYDLWPWHGVSAYVAGVGLAAVACAAAMADALGDVAAAQERRQWLARGRRAFEEKLWTGRYYRVFSDATRGHGADACLANQLMGEWCARVVGLEALFDPARVEQAQAAIEGLNVAAGAAVIVNAVRPDGAPVQSRFDGLENDHAAGCFVGESLCAAMTMLYAGQRALGLGIAEAIYQAVVPRHRTPWNQHCIISPADGHPIWGKDYYSNMAVWALPMALAGQDIAQFAAPGGLLDRLLAAGRDAAPGA
jgi:uncharacterized protein (DUF608 family)